MVQKMRLPPIFGIDYLQQAGNGDRGLSHGKVAMKTIAIVTTLTLCVLFLRPFAHVANGEAWCGVHPCGFHMVGVHLGSKEIRIYSLPESR